LINSSGTEPLSEHLKSSALLLLLLLLPTLLLPVQAQNVLPGTGSATQAEVEWSPSDLLDLPSDWLSKLENIEIDPAEAQRRADQFLIQIDQRVQGLDGENRVEAEAALVVLKNNVASLIAEIQAVPDKEQTPIPSQNFYSLEELFSLRALWRRTNNTIELRQQELGNTRQQYSLLREQVDNSFAAYNRADRNTAARVIAGLRRMSSGIELLTANEIVKRLESSLQQLNSRRDELESKLAYARSNLQPGDISSEDFDSAITSSNEALIKLAANRNALQDQLIGIVSGDGVAEFFTQLKLKQQLTLLSARESLLMVNRTLDGEKKNWHLLREGSLDSVVQIEQARARDSKLIEQLRVQIQLWDSASRTTLITPAPSLPGNMQQESFTKAQTAARDSLEVINRIEGSIDDLNLAHDLLTTEVIGKGLGSIGKRLVLLISTGWQKIQKVVDYKLFYIGDTPVTPSSLLRFILILLIGIVISWFIRRLLRRIEKRREQITESSSFYTLGRLLHYLIITIAVLAAFASLGLDLGSLALIAGALSVGIGFGLQSIVNNFLSGLILLFEGSLRAGDFIELDSGVTGVVKEISTRYTRINTNDNVDVVVPNSELVSFKLTNWTLKEPVVRMRIPFGVAYGTDKDLVRKAALEAAQEVPYTMADRMGRATDVLLVNFGESSLDFQLRVWVARRAVHRPVRVKASYYWELETKFREYGIQIPFPQRDVHMREAPVSDG
jgi:small-conductance mechanosensitive channel